MVRNAERASEARPLAGACSKAYAPADARASATYGGEGGIRTHGTVPRSQHFQCCQFNHSCTSPKARMKDEGGRMKSLYSLHYPYPFVFSLARLTTVTRIFISSIASFRSGDRRLAA